MAGRPFPWEELVTTCEKFGFSKESLWETLEGLHAGGRVRMDEKGDWVLRE